MRDDQPLIVVVDDDPSVRESMCTLLQSGGWRVESFASAREYLDREHRESPGCLVLDVNLPGLSGLELQDELSRAGHRVSIIFVTGHGDIPMSVRAIKAGAIEFFTKPFIAADLLRAVEDGVARSVREREDAPRPRPAAQPHFIDGFPGVVGSSASLRRVFDQVRAVAATDSTVLVRGETGTGKELIARAIHEHSARRHGPFVKVNCAAIPAGLLESELMGHEKGAFTGASSRRIGRFELAQNGTIVLDEIGELPLELQPKLLRLIQEREFERIGGSKTIQTNARIVAATHRDLETMVSLRSFREDLFYRINVFPVEMPPLRERREDIEPLVRYFVTELARRAGKDIHEVSPAAMDTLTSREWPGNIRELQNVIERAVILSPGPTLQLPPLRSSPTSTSSMLLATDAARDGVASLSTARDAKLDSVQRSHILSVLDECKWTISGASGAAARLGMKRTTLQFRMKKLGIVRRARNDAAE